MVRRCIGNPDSGALSKCQTLWETEDAVFRAQSLLRICAADITADINAVACFESSGVRADRLHYAGGVEPGSVGQRRFFRVCSRADIRIDRIDARGFDGDNNLMRARSSSEALNRSIP